MSSLVQKASDVLRKTNLLSNIADKTGVSKSNFFVKLTNPADQTLRAGQKNGAKGIWDSARSGDGTDPGNIFHSGNDAPIPDPGAAPTQDATVAGNAARDRIRRLAYRAQGRSSTIKVSPSAAGYSPQPKTLLGL